MFAKSNNSSKTKGLKSEQRTQTNKKINKNLCSAYVFKGCVRAIGDIIFIFRNIFLNELKLQFY